jgi:hypothetical protein
MKGLLLGKKKKKKKNPTGKNIICVVLLNIIMCSML